MSIPVSMKGRIALRAHSFKENILEVLGHHSSHNQQSHQHGHDIHHGKSNGIYLAKKTSSTDNLLGYVEPSIDTQSLVRDVQLSLKYFQDAVTKGTFELLPGCASIVLERLVGIQTYVSYEVSLKNNSELMEIMHQLYNAVSRLTEWADNVIISGSVCSTDDYIHDIINPVRDSVQALVNTIHQIHPQSANAAKEDSAISKKSNLHNSLPDIINAEEEETSHVHKQNLFHQTNSHNLNQPPPLPPKQSRRRSATHKERSRNNHHQQSVDYFTNPLFEQHQNNSASNSLPSQPSENVYSRYETSFIHNELSSPPCPFDTTITDFFPFMDETDDANFEIQSNNSWKKIPEKPPALPKKEYRHPSSHHNETTYEQTIRDRYYPQSNPNSSYLMSSRSFDQDHNSFKSHHNSIPTQVNSLVGDNKRDSPPPLPPKKRDVISYMELLGRSLMPDKEEMMQNLMMTQNVLHNVWVKNYHQFGENLTSDNTTYLNNFPNSQDLFSQRRSSPKIGELETMTSTPPALPPKKNRFASNNLNFTGHERIIPIINETNGTIITPSGSRNNSKRSSIDSHLFSVSNSSSSDSVNVEGSGKKLRSLKESELPKKRSSKKLRRPKSTSESYAVVSETSSLNKSEPSSNNSLIYANNAEGILELRAGDVDDLIILATQTTNRDYVYQDAFLLTYRTFIPTLHLLVKLEYRFKRFNCTGINEDLKIARSAFSLLVRVVDSLIDSDFHESEVVSNLSTFISELVSDGDLLLARALRTKFIQKYEEHRAKMLPDLDFGKLSLKNHKPRPLLMQFKSSELAEQITLIDAQFFWKLEPGELLLWAKEQNEEKSPNLVKFTKHFNDMSFWFRTLLLQESDNKERERLMAKLIKVLKCLRKHNNFNSYLAVLSALESAPLKRLDWSKGITETIDEYSAIIDFSGSFKAYREALSLSSPPVIPYVGLVLQDLTFVHIGNSDKINNSINFAKRWQQYNILDNVRRFKRVNYTFQRREEIIQCFGDFENFLSENQLWELSKQIKPGNRMQSSSNQQKNFHIKDDHSAT